MAENIQKNKTYKKRFIFKQVVRGAILVIVGICLYSSLFTFAPQAPHHNCFGWLGHLLSTLLRYCFGWSCWVVALMPVWFGYKKIKHTPPFVKEYFLFITLILSLMLLGTLISIHAPYLKWLKNWGYYNGNTHMYLGGKLLYAIYLKVPYLNFDSLIGTAGSFMIAITGVLMSSCYLITSTPWMLCVKLFRLVKPKIKAIAVRKESTPSEVVTAAKVTTVTPKKTAGIPIPIPKPVGEDLQGYILPPSSLLTLVATPDHTSLKQNLKNQATILEDTLLNFGIEAKVGEIHCGPTITSFEVIPSTGVKVQKIKTLENDIALNLEAKSIRIIAPIPGKAAVGIEIPSPYPEEVSFRELLEQYHKQDKKMCIPLLLGKSVHGELIWTDLTKMPHLIIAGATGSGKSVCINTMVMSIVMNAKPDEIKLIIVDPKKVELTSYTHLPHMLSPVITEATEAFAALQWLVKEMEKRYEMFRYLGIRHIHGFNERKINETLESQPEFTIPKTLPFIVCIIDELADLMMTSSSDIETPIARIAQMARAVGIHMVLATQRPSREVITGLIKANFPTRIAFKVSSRVNSQIILDDSGAETLLGNGDMLFMPPGTSNLVRVQGAFIRDEDINKVISYICHQASTQYMIRSFQNVESQHKESLESDDPLFVKAKELVFETGTASTTFLQRKLKIGYARAASLMDQLEASGVVGPSEGAKARKIFYPSTQEEI